MPKEIHIDCLCGKSLTMYEGDPEAHCTCSRRWDYKRDGTGEPVPFEAPRVVQPLLAVDLDGTIRYSRSGHKYGPVDENDVAIFEGVEAKLWACRAAGFRVVGITNQGVVGAGYATEAQVNATIRATLNAFDRNPLHEVNVCYAFAGGKVHPHHLRSLRRKPGYGMLVQAELFAFQEGVIVDWDNSTMVGDRDEDKACADAAGVRFEWAHVFFNRPAPAGDNA